MGDNEPIFLVEMAPGAWLAINDAPKDDEPPSKARERGWRPYVWTRDMARAEKFSTAKKALDFVQTSLPEGVDYVICRYVPPKITPKGVA